MTTRISMTTAEFDHMITRPGMDDRGIELIDGEIRNKPMPNELHGTVQSIIGAELIFFLRAHPELRGRVVTEGRYRPTGDNANSRLPDVAVVFNRLITNVATANFIPDICIEIKSPSETLPEIYTKTAFYLANKAKVALVVLPESRTIEIYRGDDLAEPEFVTAGGTLTLPDLLPGLAIPLTSIFPSDDMIDTSDDEVDA